MSDSNDPNRVQPPAEHIAGVAKPAEPEAHSLDAPHGEDTRRQHERIDTAFGTDRRGRY